MKIRSARTTLAFVGCMLLGSSMAFAQTTRTWVSGVGDDVKGSMINSNNVGCAGHGGGTVRLSNNSIYDNLTGFGCGGGTLASAGNNRKAGNVGGVVPVCAPTVTITIQ